MPVSPLPTPPIKVYLSDPDPSICNALCARLRRIPADVTAHASADTLIAQVLADHASNALHEDAIALIAITSGGDGELADLQRVRNTGFKGTLLCHAHSVDDALRARLANAGIDALHETPLLGRWLADLPHAQLPTGQARAPATTTTLPTTLPTTRSKPNTPNTRLRDGRLVTIRSMRPEDAAQEQAFVRGLSAASRRTRFFSAIRELSPTMLHEFTHPDYPRSCALIASVRMGTAEGDEDRQVAVARYAPVLPGTHDSVPASAEFAIVVADDWQGCGLAARLLRDLISAASIAGLARLEGLVLRDNRRMLRFARALGFTSSVDPEDHTISRIVRLL